MKAERVGSDTLLGQIVNMVGEAQRSRAPIQGLADKVAGIFVPTVLAVSVITFAVWMWLGPEPKLAHAIVNAVAVLIIACPCALGLASIAVLLGLEPGKLVTELSPPMPLPTAPPEVPVGLPSDLLRRRPDVRRAERQLAAETARIGVAKSDWYPKLSLTGDVGTESVSLSKWFEPGSLFWSVGPSLEWRALDFARVRAEVRGQTAVQEAALATYEKTVLISLQEAENALVTYAQEQNRHRALADEVAENQRSLDMANSLYAKGRVNYLDVLDVRRSLYQSDDQLAVSDQAVSLDLIALYKALGGGWETMTPKPAKALSTASSP
jgi:NodT family efflux transporter outer membrane factor (OMF) lipoprotein